MPPMGPLAIFPTAPPTFLISEPRNCSSSASLDTASSSVASSISSASLRTFISPSYPRPVSNVSP